MAKAPATLSIPIPHVLGWSQQAHCMGPALSLKMINVFRHKKI